MAGKRTGLIARWLARRAGRADPQNADVEVAPAREADAGTDAHPVTPAPAAPAGSPGAAGDATSPSAASSAIGATEPSMPATGHEAPTVGTPTDAAFPAAPTPEGPSDVEPVNGGSAAPADPCGRPDGAAPGPEAGAPEVPEVPDPQGPVPDPQGPVPGVRADGTQDAAAGGSEAETEERPEAETDSAHGATPDAGKTRDHRVITLVSLVEHAGAATLAAALERRGTGTGWRIRTAGPGLLRAAFAGMLEDTDALVLVCPADPATTATLGEKLLWLEANNRPGMPARTLVVVNLKAADGGELVLPADLDRPVALLPFDAALGIPADGTRSPRRATRRALDQLVDELSTILQEH